MANLFEDLPDDLRAEFLSFLKEVNGEWEVADMMGLVGFIATHHKQYPDLLKLVRLNEEWAIKHFQETGEVPPGVKIVKRTEVSPKVTQVEIFHGPRKGGEE